MDVLIVYASSKGHTGRIALILKEVLERSSLSVIMKNVFEAQPQELENYPYVLLGCSTYGQGDLQSDFLDFERGMDALELSGIHAAVFGSGNSRYAYFAEAVDILEARLKIIGARILLPGLRQDMMYESPEGEAVRSWASELTAVLLNHEKNGRPRFFF